MAAAPPQLRELGGNKLRAVADEELRVWGVNIPKVGFELGEVFWTIKEAELCEMFQQVR